jgi:hypothetical protein
MRAKHWLMFTAWQLAGTLAGLGASHVDHFSWTISVLMLLPGDLLNGYLFRLGGIGNYWPKWTLFAVAAAVNILLFATIDLYKRTRRAQSKPS